MRLIDADEMKKYCIEGLKACEQELKIVGRYDIAKKMTEDICKDIDEQPTVDLEEHDDEIRRKTINEFIERFNKSTIIMGRATGRTFMLKCLNEIANQMKGETE